MADKEREPITGSPTENLMDVKQSPTTDDTQTSTHEEPKTNALITLTDHDDHIGAVEEDTKKLPRVADRLSIPIIIVVLIGGAERFAYYAVTLPWQNYIQNPRHSPELPGALGLGQSRATSISNAYMIFTFLTPLPLALVSDLYLGRYKTLLLSLIVYLVGVLIQFVTSLPVALDHGAGGGGLAVAMILIGIGAGGVKATFSPFLGDQYVPPSSPIKDKDGKRTLVDRGLTLQLIYNVFYWATNIACLSGIPATFLERIYGPWAAFLLGFAALWVSLGLLIATSSKLVKTVPQGNVVLPTIKAMICAAKNGFKIDNAKSAHQLSRHGKPSPFTDEFLDEVKLTLRTCRILLSFVVFYLSVNQIANNFISQAAQMDRNGVPNDMFPTFAGLACVLLGPVIQAMYNVLARYRMSPGQMLLITLGFILCGGALSYSAGIQHLIYTSPPCYDHPLTCEPGSVPNRVSVWLQLPAYFIFAVGEIFGFVTVSEIAFKDSPKDAKAMVQALAQLAACFGSVLGLAISPVAKDPNMVVYYASLAGIMVVAAGIFWFFFGKYDAEKHDSDDKEEKTE